MKLLILIFLSLFYAQLTWSDSKENLTITISGNKRTQTRYIKLLLKNCAQRTQHLSPSSLTDEEMKDCLLNSKLFSDVTVSRKNKNLDISVKDRWTLIPIPVFSSSNDSNSIGLFLMETNFLGLGKVVGAGGKLSSEGNSFFFMYNDQNVFLTNWIGKLIFANTSQELYAYHKNEKLYGYKLSAKLYELTLGRQLTPQIKGMMSYGLSQSSYDRLDQFTAPSGYRGSYIEPKLSFSDQKFKFYFNQGPFVNLTYRKQLTRNDNLEKGNFYDLTFGYDYNLFKDHALQFLVSQSKITKNTIKDTDYVGNNKGSRGIQRGGLWVKELTTLSLDYQIPVKEKSHGTWTVAPFFDYGLVNSIVPEQNISSYYSYGLGAYLFFKQIALPGVGIIVGKNSQFEDQFFSISVGLRTN